MSIMHVKTILLGIFFIVAANNGVAKDSEGLIHGGKIPEAKSKWDNNVPSSFSGNVKRTALRHIIQEADLIFSGVVEHVDYKASNIREKDDVTLPHTFVTYKIERIFKGKTADDTITLRFQGGRTEVAKGKFEYLTSPAIPLFDVEDRDILFVKKNGQSICPLVGCKKGRLRVIDYKIYTYLGHPVGLSEDIRLSLPFLRDDIIQPLELFGRFLSPKSKIDKSISSKFGNDVYNSMRIAMKALPHSAAVKHAKQLLAQAFNDISGINNLMIPPQSSNKYGIPPQIIFHSLLSENTIKSASLRDQTKRLLSRDQTTLSFNEGVLLNRLLLEDYYYPYIVRSLRKSLVKLPYKADEIPHSVKNATKTHEAMGVRISLMTLDKNDPSGDRVSSRDQRQSENKPVDISAKEFFVYLNASIDMLHTKKELDNIQPVPSIRIDKPFYAQEMKAVRLPNNLTRINAGNQVRTQLELSEEEKAMIKSGFDPVLKPWGIE